MTNKLSNLEIQSESDFCNHYPAKLPSSNYSPKPKMSSFRKGVTRTLAGLLMLGASIVGAAGLSSCENPYQPSTTNTSQTTKTNHAPEITSFSISPDSGNAPLNVTADGSATDSDGDTLSYNTVIKDSNGDTIKSVQSNSVDYTFKNSGNYEIVFTATDGKISRSEKKLVTVSTASTNPPTVDLSTISNTDAYNSSQNSPDLDEETQSEITLPLQDSSNQDVSYTLTGHFANLESVALNGNILTLKSGDISTNESYSVDLGCTETANGKAVTIDSPLTGIIHNHPDISIIDVKSSGDNVSIKQAIAEAGYVDSNGVYQHLNNLVSNNGTETFKDCKENEGVYSTSDGKIDFQIEERADELAKIAPNGFSVKVGKGAPVEYTDSEEKTHATASGSFLQTQDFLTDSNGKGDYSGLEFVVATYDNDTVGLPGSGATYSPEQFFDFCDQINFTAPYNNPDGKLTVNYSTNNVELLSTSPNQVDNVSFADINSVKQAIAYWKGIKPALQWNGQADSSLQKGNFIGGVLYPTQDWVTIVPVSPTNSVLGGNDGITFAYTNDANPTIRDAVIYLRNNLEGPRLTKLAEHELYLTLAAPQELSKAIKTGETPSQESLSSHDVILNSLSNLDKCYIDKIATESAYANKKASYDLSYNF